MQNNLIARISFFLILVPFLAWLNGSPGRAQVIANGPQSYSGSFATPFARYYAPYAIQAAAAYIEVAKMDAAAIDGSDVDLAVKRVMENDNDPIILHGAKKYLRPWQYQFGSEGYLRCYGRSDNSCYSWNDWLKLGPGGGLAFHVWARTGFPRKKDGSACSEVSIAFRGTDPYARADWIADADQLAGYVYDTHYRQLRRNIDAILQRITSLDCYRLAKLGKRTPQIVSVGHSLGAGLAQMAGIANPQIVKVFAFDSSPITGASYFKDPTKNGKTLTIDRIYQNNEILQIAQKAQQYPKAKAPCVRYVEYGVLQGVGPAGLHNMPALARGIVRLSYPNDELAASEPAAYDQATYKPPRKLLDCNSNYVVPRSDEDISEPLVSSRDFPSTRFAEVDRRGSIVGNAKTRAFTFEASPQARTLSLFDVPQARTAHVRSISLTTNIRVHAPKLVVKPRLRIL